MMETVNNINNGSSIKDKAVDRMTQRALKSAWSDHRPTYEPKHQQESFPLGNAMINTSANYIAVNNNDADRRYSARDSRVDNAINDKNITWSCDDDDSISSRHDDDSIRSRHDANGVNGYSTIGHDRNHNDVIIDSHPTNHNYHNNYYYSKQMVHSQQTHHVLANNNNHKNNDHRHHHRKQLIIYSRNDELNSGVSLTKGNLNNLRGKHVVRSVSTCKGGENTRNIINQDSPSNKSNRNTRVLSRYHLDSSIMNHDTIQYQYPLPSRIHDMQPSPKPSINIRENTISTATTTIIRDATNNDIRSRDISSSSSDGNLQIVTDVISPIISKSTPSSNCNRREDDINTRVQYHDNDWKHLYNSRIEQPKVPNNNVDPIYHQQQQQQQVQQHHVTPSQSRIEKTSLHQPYRYGPEIIGSPVYYVINDDNNNNNDDDDAIKHNTNPIADRTSVHARSVIDVAKSTAVRLESACSAAEYLINSIASDVDRLRSSERYTLHQRHDDNNSGDEDNNRHDRENSMDGSKMEVTMSILQQMMTTMKKSRTAIAMISGLPDDDIPSIDRSGFDYSCTDPSSHDDHDLNWHHLCNDNHHEHPRSQMNTNRNHITSSTEDKGSMNISDLSQLMNSKPLVHTTKTSSIASQHHQNHSRDVESKLASSDTDDNETDYYLNHRRIHLNHSSNNQYRNNDNDTNYHITPRNYFDPTDSAYNRHANLNLTDLTAQCTSQSVDDGDISNWNKSVEMDVINDSDNKNNDLVDDVLIDDHFHTPMNDQVYPLNTTLIKENKNKNNIHKSNELLISQLKDTQLTHRSGYRLLDKRYEMRRALVTRMCIAQGPLWKVWNR